MPGRRVSAFPHPTDTPLPLVRARHMTSGGTATKHSKDHT